MRSRTAAVSRRDGTCSTLGARTPRRRTTRRVMSTGRMMRTRMRATGSRPRIRRTSQTSRRRTTSPSTTKRRRRRRMGSRGRSWRRRLRHRTGRGNTGRSRRTTGPRREASPRVAAAATRAAARARSRAGEAATAKPRRRSRGGGRGGEAAAVKPRRTRRRRSSEAVRWRRRTIEYLLHAQRTRPTDHPLDDTDTLACEARAKLVRSSCEAHKKFSGGWGGFDFRVDGLRLECPARGSWVARMAAWRHVGGSGPVLAAVCGVCVHTQIA
mmetsp:Transcript_10647/g.22379  ORF Transcript_10647/g.22379 Transcript_10647/m.22379 type:complete len:269 (+) Transcript_10647:484-1290(+)